MVRRVTKKKLKLILTNRSSLVLFVGIFGIIGGLLIIATHAATFTSSIEPENSTINTPAKIGLDSQASGGKYVQFGGPVVDASTMNHKLMFGYQGWFQCPTDGAPNPRWFHWFDGTPPAYPQMDQWPDTSELTSSERCPTGLTYPNGQPAYLFSGYNAATVMRHFQWMQQNNLDGVMLQRFISELSDPNQVIERNKVTANVKAGAEATGRVFNIMYDISGASTTNLVSVIENDWMNMVDTQKVTSSSRYLKQNGKPVVVIWGFGFPDRPGTPSQVSTLMDFFHNNPNPAYRAFVMGGVNNDWRTNSTWASALTGFDAISPWMVGRINSLQSADKYKSTTAAELSYATSHGQLYMPVVFPGYSFHNQNSSKPLNEIPRLGGNFVWRQAYNDLSVGATMMYGAMFDEVNEGTAFFKTAPTSNDWPSGLTMVPLDADGYTQLPSDWYLKVGGELTKMVHGTIPVSSTMSITPH